MFNCYSARIPQESSSTYNDRTLFFSRGVYFKSHTFGAPKSSVHALCRIGHAAGLSLKGRAGFVWPRGSSFADSVAIFGTAAVKESPSSADRFADEWL